MRIKVSGSYRKIGEWGVNFGPLSNVDAEIPDSGGLTLRDLRECGEIPVDCFDDSEDEPAYVEPVEDKDGE